MESTPGAGQRVPAGPAGRGRRKRSPIEHAGGQRGGDHGHGRRAASAAGSRRCGIRRPPPPPRRRQRPQRDARLLRSAGARLQRDDRRKRRRRGRDVPARALRPRPDGLPMPVLDGYAATRRRARSANGSTTRQQATLRSSPSPPTPSPATTKDASLPAWTTTSASPTPSASCGRSWRAGCRGRRALASPEPRGSLNQGADSFRQRHAPLPPVVTVTHTVFAPSVA